MNPKLYIVGGAVRDILLGRHPKDTDYFIDNVDAEWMVKSGYRKVDVGGTQPVFLDDNGVEFTIPRTIEEGRPGIFDDLKRRDFTINAMAIDERGNLIDPHLGFRDLRNNTLKHVHDGIFKEDPIRILRMVRMAISYDLAVDSQTILLASSASELLDSVSIDRIWKELEKGVRVHDINRYIVCLRAATFRSKKLMQIVKSRYYNSRCMHAIMVNQVPTNFLIPLYFNCSKDTGANNESIRFSKMLDFVRDFHPNKVGDSQSQVVESVYRFWKKYRISDVKCEANTTFLRSAFFVFSKYKFESLIKAFDFLEEQKIEVPPEIVGKAYGEYLDNRLINLMIENNVCVGLDSE